MLKNVINVDKENVFQDVPDILSGIVATELPTQKMDEQNVLGICEETRMLRSEIDTKVNALVIVNRMNDKELITK